MTGRSRPQRLGVALEAGGARARVRSDPARSVRLCLFDGAGAETDRLPLERGADGVWEVFVPGLEPGWAYGLRADGAHAPARGLRFDAAKLLLDPYARRVTGGDRWHPAFDARGYGVDTASVAPRGVVVDPAFDWRGDRRPATPWEETVIYELHVKGMTARHPEVPAAERGTYLGLTHPAVIEHLTRLGVTAVELLPVQQSFSERHLVERGLTNYWGYNPIGLFAPDARWAATEDPVREFKEMVRRLHAAGIEVVLDVVLNHTAEGGAGGPTLSLKGLDNAGYYRLDPQDPTRYVNHSGCGNTLDFGRRRVIDLAVEALRYWVEEMRVDGFRFDLAVTLGRGADDRFDPRAPFFTELAAEPALAGVKLIAEPWDLGPDGYQLGAFPAGWREWNDRFRDAVCRYWNGGEGDPDELRLRLAGSPDIFPPAAGRATASVNYVTCHDGFTLEDLVSYERRRNDANGEGNRDGHPDEASRNWGEEGPSRDPEVLTRRRQAKRGMLASVALAAGVPMLSHGDELGRTQRGNNNAYSQDSELTWLDWDAAASGAADVAFVRRLLALRRRQRRASR